MFIFQLNFLAQHAQNNQLYTCNFFLCVKCKTLFTTFLFYTIKLSALGRYSTGGRASWQFSSVNIIESNVSPRTGLVLSLRSRPPSRFWIEIKANDIDCNFSTILFLRLIYSPFVYACVILLYTKMVQLLVHLIFYGFYYSKKTTVN